MPRRKSYIKRFLKSLGIDDRPTVSRIRKGIGLAVVSAIFSVILRLGLFLFIGISIVIIAHRMGWVEDKMAIALYIAVTILGIMGYLSFSLTKDNTYEEKKIYGR